MCSVPTGKVCSQGYVAICKHSNTCRGFLGLTRSLTPVLCKIMICTKCIDLHDFMNLCLHLIGNIPAQAASTTALLHSHSFCSLIPDPVCNMCTRAAWTLSYQCVTRSASWLHLAPSKSGCYTTVQSLYAEGDGRHDMMPGGCQRQLGLKTPSSAAVLPARLWGKAHTTASGKDCLHCLSYTASYKV